MLEVVLSMFGSKGRAAQIGSTDTAAPHFSGTTRKAGDLSFSEGSRQSKKSGRNQFSFMALGLRQNRGQFDASDGIESFFRVNETIFREELGDGFIR